MSVRAEDVTAHRLPDWATKLPDAQRACYVALRRKGWWPSVSRIAGVQAQKQGKSVHAMSWRKLLDKAARQDEKRGFGV